jgi:putative membrane protein
MNTYERVSLWALIYFIGRTLILFLRQAVNMIPIAVVIVTGGDQLRLVILWLLATGLPVLIVLHAVASWWCFRYRADAHTLHVREGILKRTQLTLDYDRIQQADIRQPWYFRPFGQSILGVESAGSDGKEVELAGLAYDQAELLRQAMMQHKENAQGQEATGSPAEDYRTETDRPVAGFRLTLPLSELVRYGLMHNPVLLALPVVAYPLSQLDLIDDWVIPRVEGLVTLIERGGGVLQATLLWVGGVLAVLLVLVAASIVLSIVRYYGFTLTVTGQRYQTRAGLLSVVSRSFQYVRLQRLVWSQGMIARAMSRRSLRIDQTGRPDTMQQAKTFFIPILNAEREAGIKQQLRLTEANWQSVHPASMILPWLVTTSAFTFLVALSTSWSLKWVLGSLLLICPGVALFVWASWRQRAVHIDDDWIALRRGMIGQQQSWIPAYKMQTLRIRQGPWLRLWGASALQVLGAGGRETIAWLPVAKIEALQSRLTQCTADYQGRWM